MENSIQILRYLTVEDILNIAEGQVGSYQLLHESQLHYLVEIVGDKWGDTEFYPTLLQKAAVYAHHIITGHIFVDGNKRIGLTCVLRFLKLNGYSPNLRIDDSLIELGFEIAKGTITDLEVIATHIQSWVQRQTDESVVFTLDMLN